MIECTDPIRVQAQAYYERTITPDNAARGVLPVEAFRFTDVVSEDSIDSLEPLMIAHTHSSLDAFKTCARQYQARYILKEIKFESTEATRYGDRVHDALENRLKNKTPLPAECAELEGMCQSVENLRGEGFAEQKLAISEHWKSASYWDKQECWFRGKVDYIKIDRERKVISVFDWKTGKPKKDRDQLDRMALIASINFPGMEKIKTAFVYTKTGEVDSAVILASELPAIEAKLLEDIKRVELAVKNNMFPPNPSGLCKPSRTSSYPGCPVESCPFHASKS